MGLRRTQLGYLSSLLLPVKGQWLGGALCLTCGRPVSEEELVEGLPGRDTWCRVLVRCHRHKGPNGHHAEELRRFEFDSVEWDERDLKRLMMSARFFDPNEQGEALMAQVAREVGFRVS